MAGAGSPYDVTVGALLDRAAAERGGLPALVDPGRGTVHYAEYRSRARLLAERLREAGVGPGDRIAAVLPNCAEYCFLLGAAAYLGAAVVSINVRYTARELAHILDDARPAVAVAATSAGSARPAALVGGLLGERPYVRELVELDVAQPLEPAVSGEPAAGEGAEAGVDADAPLLLIYTSGTTGAPKGATLTHRNVIASADGYAERIGIGGEDRVSVFTPMFHAGGMVNGVVTSLLTGATAVLLSGFRPDVALRVLRDEAVTVYLGVPTMLLAQLDLPEIEATDLPRLRAIATGGGPVRPDLLGRARRAFGADRVHVVYGLTEANMATVTDGIVAPVADGPVSVGPPARAFEVRVVDERREPVGPGATGEVAVRGPAVFAGYWGNRAATDAILDGDGWLHTGDHGHLDADGALTIAGRSVEMYVQGGSNVYPAEVERVLEQHPAVALAAVVGLPDPLLGESGHAFVVPRRGSRIDTDDLLLFAAGQLASYKLPKHVHERVELPLTPFGKVHKSLIAERAISDLGDG